MSYSIKKRFFLPILLLIIGLLISINQVEARSGCCSHHGGVCGCGCCDGTSLSSTCAPYYPECNGGIRTVESQPTRVNQTPVVISPKPVVVYTSPSPRPSIKPSPSSSPSPVMLASPVAKSSPTPEVLGEEKKSNSTTGVVLGTGGITYVIWRAIKQKWPFQSTT